MIITCKFILSTKWHTHTEISKSKSNWEHYSKFRYEERKISDDHILKTKENVYKTGEKRIYLSHVYGHISIEWTEKENFHHNSFALRTQNEWKNLILTVSFHLPFIIVVVIFCKLFYSLQVITCIIIVVRAATLSHVHI